MPAALRFGLRTLRNGVRMLFPSCLLLPCLLLDGGAARAAIVTVTLTGTVGTGTDFTGVFGFPPKTSLAGQPFTAVYTFDDSKGTPTTKTNTAGTVTCAAGVASTNTSSPGTATLVIGNSAAFPFGTFANPVAQTTSTSLVGGLCPGPGFPSISLNVNVSDFANSVNRLDTLNFSSDLVGVEFENDNSWEYKLANAPVAGGGGQVNINRTLANGTLQQAEAQLNAATISVSGGTPPTAAPLPLRYTAITPCRVVDTRNPNSTFGGPEISAGSTREFDLPKGACSLGDVEFAYALNVTVVPSGPLGYLTVWPSGAPQPTASTLNSDGRVKANAAIVRSGVNGGISVFATNATHVIIDVVGFYTIASGQSDLAFYPVTPCRVVDTRDAAGALGGPTMAANSSRDFPVQSGGCNIPSDAKAYSFNVTSVPHGPLGYLTMWPTGATQPLASTLNAPTGTVTANAALVPAGTKGAISVFVTGTTDLVLDINGYFADPSANGLSLYMLDPCRVIDTRNGSGAIKGTFGINVGASPCGEAPSAQAYVLNATVVPQAPLGFLTLWPAGEAQPLASTLNAGDGATTSNMAITPTLNGSIDASATDPTNLILDLSGYFAP
jgi:hypothetical protein